MNDFDARIDACIDAEMRGVAVACKKGCSWCCHQLVVLTCWDDARRILSAARSRFTPAEFATFEAQVRAQAAAIGRLGHEAAQARRWPCPLLKDCACSVYDERPVACRSVFSPDAECCRAMMEADEFEDLPPAQQTLAAEIGQRAFRLQVTINDRRPIDGARELRELLVALLDEDQSRAEAGLAPRG